MNFQYAVASIRRICTPDRLPVRHILLAFCVLNLTVSLASEIAPWPAFDAESTHPDSHLQSYAGDSRNTPLVRTMAQQVALPGNRSNASQTPSDRTIATVTPIQDDSRSELPSDPRRDQQWSFFETSHYKGASALFAAREHSSGNFPVVVAVVDSGVVLDHEDLELLPGYDFISDNRVANDGDGRDSDPSDPGDWVTAEEIASDPVSSGCTPTRSKWHGTAVSGIIGAVSGNQRGITGGAPSVLLVPVRVTGKCGGYIKDLVDGVRWAAGLPVSGAPLNGSPARVINLSVGFPGDCPASLQNAIDSAVNAGAVIVAASTNSGVVLDTDPQAPANCTNVTTVGALLRDGSLAPYSAVGTAVMLLAPGGSVNDGIITTQNASGTSPVDQSGYGYHFGTSMAAAHVSATFAMLLSIDPALTNSELEHLARQSATGSGDIPGCAQQLCGAGRLNAKAAADLLFESSSDQSLLDQSDDDLSLASASLITRPATAAANDAATAVRPNTTGGGLFEVPLISMIASLALLRRWRRQQLVSQSRRW